MMKFDVAVVGAGIAGLAAAGRLRISGCRVLLIDKARGPGGRLATRHGVGEIRMDHGCQYLVEGSDDESSILQSDARDDCLGIWRPNCTGSNSMHLDNYPEGDLWHVGVPTMSAIPRSMARDLQVKLKSRVATLKRIDDDWLLLDTDDQPIAQATWVLSAIPSPQAIDLLAPHEFSGLEVMSKATYDPNWTLMVVEPGSTTGEPDVIEPQNGSIAWIVNQKSKPGRPEVDAWVAQATTRWSTDNLELDQAQVIQKLLPEMSAAIGRQVNGETSAHRWRYAFVNDPAGEPSLLDPDRKLAACGDWCLGNRVTHAITSGRAAAQTILRNMK